MRFHQWGRYSRCCFFVVIVLIRCCKGYFIALPWHRAFSALDDLIDRSSTTMYCMYCTTYLSAEDCYPRSYLCVPFVCKYASIVFVLGLYSLRNSACLPAMPSLSRR